MSAVILLTDIIWSAFSSVRLSSQGAKYALTLFPLS
jgi:hypothetical protein